MRGARIISLVLMIAALTATSRAIADSPTDSYVSAVTPRVQQRLVLPAGFSQKRSFVLATLTIARDGRLVAARITRGSGNELLDNAVRDAIRRAAPFRPLPSHLRGDRAELGATIELTLSRRLS
jgi:protein TonB